MSDDKQEGKFTWDENDVVWEKEPGGKPLIEKPKPEDKEPADED